ncbi:MAG: hypothetical protein OXD42_11145, partial [Rhodospirillaceae bacterium]|nr:hypothetical protein [Rhodospirillaceae bacterium]
MTAFKSDFMTVLHDRGYVHQCTDETALDDKAATSLVTAYIGFDVVRLGGFDAGMPFPAEEI